jgi:plastocyanin
MTPRLRRTASLAFAGCLLVLGCGGGADSAAPAPEAPPGGATITANHQAFDRTELAIPAERPFALVFENRESAPHNVTLLSDTTGDPVFAGEIFGGPGARTYAIPAIPAGTYRFRCDVHPEMVGTAIAARP